MSGEFVPFACPVCGAVRDISSQLSAAISRGVDTGECRRGSGCRAAVSKQERLRRWWLIVCGVSELQIRRSGGAVPFVLEFGMPELPQRPVQARDVGGAVRSFLPATGGERARSKLPRFCFEEAEGDPELALSLAIEIVLRGLPVHGLLAAAESDGLELAAA